METEINYLVCNERVIYSSTFHQFVVSSHLRHLSFVKPDYQICRSDGGQPVCNNQRGSALTSLTDEDKTVVTQHVKKVQNTFQYPASFSDLPPE